MVLANRTASVLGACRRHCTAMSYTSPDLVEQKDTETADGRPRSPATPRSEREDRTTVAHRNRRSRRGGGGVEPHIAVVAFLLPPPPRGGPEHDLWTKLSETRQKWDSAVDRWVPHITLIPPFEIPWQAADQRGSSAGESAESVAVQDGIKEVCDRIRGALQGCAKHRLALDDVGVFKLHRYWNVHLRPSASTAATAEHSDRLAFVAMQHELSKATSDITAQGGRGNRSKGQRQGQRHRERPFAPHASLGQAYDEAQLDELVKAGKEISGTGEGASAPHRHHLQFTVDRIALLTKPSSRGGPYDVQAEFDLS
ncbi:unnamed protein product [Parajaminaea phylloscopi]